MVLLLAVIYLTFISLGLPDSLFGVAWPVAHIEFGISESFGSIYSIIVAITTGGVSFFAGSLIRKFGTGKVTAVSVLLTAIGMLGVSFAPNVWIMMLFSVVCGLGAGAIDSGLNSFVSVHYKAIHMNWLHCFWGVGVTVSPLIMSYFLKNNDWRSGYRVVAFIQFGITLVVFVSLILWKKYDTNNGLGEPEISDEKPKLTFSQIIRTRGLIFGILSLGFYCAMEQLLLTWGASFLVNTKALSASVAAKYVSGYFGGIMLGRFISGLVSLNVSDKNLVRAGIICSFIGMIFLFIPGNILSLVGLILIGVGYGPIFPAIIHLIPKRFGEDRAPDVTGFHMGGAYAVGFGMQVAFGYTATATTFEIMPYCLIVFCVLCILFSEITNRVTKKTEQA